MHVVGPVSCSHRSSQDYGLEVEIRDFTEVDQAATRALIQEGLRERRGLSFDPNANPDTDDIWASYVVVGGEVVVAVSQTQIVGTGTLIETGGDCGQLVRMATDGSHRRKESHARS